MEQDTYIIMEELSDMGYILTTGYEQFSLSKMVSIACKEYGSLNINSSSILDNECLILFLNYYIQLTKLACRNKEN